MKGEKYSFEMNGDGSGKMLELGSIKIPMRYNDGMKFESNDSDE